MRTDQAPSPHLLRKIEALAVRLLSDGYSPDQVRYRTGVPVERLRALVNHAQPRPVPQRIPKPTATPAAEQDMPCDHPGCGQHRTRPGPPGSGWVKVSPVAELALWFCGWDCAIRYAQKRRAA